MLLAVLVAAFLPAGTGLSAQSLRLAHLFSDHAVLQRETDVPVWGWGEPGATVKVCGSWDGTTVKTRVAADSTWRVELSSGAAGGPYTLTVSSGRETLTLEDIALGEVWICSGQSNMEMPVRGFGFQKVEGAREAILAAPATQRQIRVFDIKTGKCTAPIPDVEASWALSTAEVAAETSAIAYFFAWRLAQDLDVPVGIIVNAWGGSRIEPWMTRESIASAGISAEDRAFIDSIEEKPDRWPETTALIWNGRVKPIAGYAAKGIIWYQGCSNLGPAQDCYDKLQAAMVKLWRREWGRDLPFIYTLLAPHAYGDANYWGRPSFVLTQLHTEALLDNAWAVCTETLGDRVTIHPARKQPVADMMVQRALQNVYGIHPGWCIELPRPASVEYLEDGRVKVQLTYVWSNLMDITDRGIRGFELAGDDRQFKPAEAEVDWDGQTIFVKCEAVPRPVAVRYGFRNWMDANLQTSYGIPVPPFRTDNWDL